MGEQARVGCAVLAAGAGVRFGSPGAKLVAAYGGKPLVQHAVDAACASNAATVTIVVGAGADLVLSSVDTRRAAVVRNDAWSNGIASSIAAALAASGEMDACILMLGDQPHVTSGDLNALIDAHGRAPRAIVALKRARVWGAPVLYPREDFTALMRLRGDAGAKRYALEQTKRLSFVPALRADAFADVDAPSDLKRPAKRRIHGTRRSRARR